MKAALKPCKFVIVSGLLSSVLCSCATIHPPLPAEVPLNRDAARGNLMTVTLRLKSGEELLFAVDTGSGGTLLDSSLEPKLGHRIDSVPILEDIRDSKHPGGVSLNPLLYLGEEPLKLTNYIGWGTREPANVYAAPTLYLGDTPLKNDGNAIVTSDIKWVIPAGLGLPPIQGILGMDILDHYCIQFDFEAGKMRFLDPRHLNVADLGKAIPISFYSEGNNWGLFHPYIQQPSLPGGPVTDVFIDTGLTIDGTVDPELFQREIAQQNRQEQPPVQAHIGGVYFGKSVWNGETYTNLFIGSGGGAFENGKNPNFIGLEFLARHLVTLDFPDRMMYLKQTRSGPLMDENIEAAEALLNDLKAKGDLPGWPAKDLGTIYWHILGLQIQFDGRKNSDSSSDYHYEFRRLSRDSPWKLQTAWRTDQDGKTIEEFRVPK